jgi:uncharacterized protein (TIGR02996 family)
MGDGNELLLAIRRDPHEDALRLAYADSLQGLGDPRGEYLRLECELRQTWSYLTPRRELFPRLALLRSRIDPAWLAQVRRCTTPPPPVDVAEAIPELRRSARESVRLHPRPGEGSRHASKVGGVFLWPSEEEWPTCPDHDCPLVPALQLRKEEVPEVGFHRGTDLLQLLWCPHVHEPEYCPAVASYWRKWETIRDPVESHPIPTASEDLLPKPCLLYPERVVEYPDPFEFDEGLYGRIEASESLKQAVDLVRPLAVNPWDVPDDAGRLYQCWLSAADGTKVGGYPDWVQDPDYPACSCGAMMDLLVTFSSCEFDGITWGRWLPIQERDLLTAGNEVRGTVQSAMDVRFGDAGNLYVFVCRTCEARPIRWLMQCS